MAPKPTAGRGRREGAAASITTGDLRFDRGAVAPAVAHEGHELREQRPTRGDDSPSLSKHFSSIPSARFLVTARHDPLVEEVFVSIVPVAWRAGYERRLLEPEELQRAEPLDKARDLAGSRLRR